MKETFIVCLIVIALAILIYYLFFRMKKGIKTVIIYAFIICLVAISILVYPLLDYDNSFTRAFASFIYATKCISLSQDLNVLSYIHLNNLFGYVYFALINFFFITLPCLSVGIIVSFVEHFVTYIKIRLFRNKKICVFSELNDKSLIVAKNLEKEYVIIFANVKEKSDIGVKSIKTNKNVLDLKFSNKSDITFYMIYEDEERNLNESLALINKYRNCDKRKIYIVNSNPSTPVILDSMNKGLITVEIINENERLIFNLLDSKPLFLNTINKTISILIVGCGNIGREFFNDAIWCGMIPGYKLKIMVVDLKADKIKEKIAVDAPELFANYDITFIEGDIKSNKVIKEIKKVKDINYVTIALGNDDKNIDTGIMLRKLFIREFDWEPIINIFTENSDKQEQIIALENEKGYSYSLNSFGSVRDLYKQYTSEGSELEKLAIKIHLAYDSEDKELKRYNLRDYNKRSSRACAVHIKYKLYAVLGDKYTDDIKKNQNLFRKMYSDKIEELLARNEHERWMAYMRSIGYIMVGTNKVKKYYEKNKHYIHYLARLHPALVDYDELDKVSKELSKITNKDINLKENDRMIIKLLNEKIDL